MLMMSVISGHRNAQNAGLISQYQYAYIKHSSTTVALIRAVDA